MWRRESALLLICLLALASLWKTRWVPLNVRRLEATIRADQLFLESHGRSLLSLYPGLSRYQRWHRRFHLAPSGFPARPLKWPPGYVCWGGRCVQLKRNFWRLLELIWQWKSRWLEAKFSSIIVKKHQNVILVCSEVIAVIACSRTKPCNLWLQIQINHSLTFLWSFPFVSQKPNITKKNTDKLAEKAALHLPDNRV